METITWSISIKKILEDNRMSFLSQYWNLTRDVCFQSVNKVLNCGDPTLWFATYRCDDCSHNIHIPFSCKSRFCSSCSKPQSDNRFNRLVARRPSWVQYYHLAFTIPEELRSFFKRHRKALKLLPLIASQAIQYYYSKQWCKAWILAVIHTFWAKLNWNPHTHLIITDWWFAENWRYKKVPFIPYKLILASRKRYLLKSLKERCYGNLQNPKSEIKQLNFLYQQENDDGNEKSRYIYFSKKAASFKVVFTYIGRYLKRPVIGQSRILKYENDTVVFRYKDKYDNEMKKITLPAIDFIWQLIQHIPEKNFPMIYYYWIFANRCKKKYLLLLYTYLWKWPIELYSSKNYRERKSRYMRHDPFACSCWGQYILFSIRILWYPKKYFREHD